MPPTRWALTLAALMVLASHSAQAALDFSGCHFGSLPGAWNRSAALGVRWTFTEQGGQCGHLEPLLSRMRSYERKRFFSMTGNRVALRDPRSKLILKQSLNPPKWVRAPTNIYKRAHPVILFLGDHHDRSLMLDTCQYIRALKPSTLQHCPRYPDLSQEPDADEKKHRFMYFSVCENGAASFAMRYVPGANPQGPYHKQDQLEGVSSSNSSWAVRTRETLALFTRYYRKDPDMVLLHANYWDLMGFRWQDDQRTWPSQGLPAQVVGQWRDNMTAWIKHLRLELPHDTLIVLRTAPVPKVDSKGSLHLKQLGGTLPITQLNDAIRLVARDLNLTYLDTEMHLKNMDTKLVQRDNLNPSSWLNLEWTNMLLNVLQQHKPRLFTHVQQGA